MISKTEQSTIPFIQNFEASAQKRALEPQWLSEWRQKGLERFQQLGIPNVKNEEWKYTDITPIIKRKYQLNGQEQWQDNGMLAAYSAATDIHIVFINGAFSEALSNISHLPKGLKITSFEEALTRKEGLVEQLLKKYKAEEENAFTALNRAFFSQGFFLDIGADSILKDRLIHIIHVTHTPEKEIFTAPRSLITIGESAEAAILETHLCSSNTAVYLVNSLTDIFLAENATLNYGKAQNESPQSFHISQTRVWQDRNSNFNSSLLTTQGAIIRNNLDVILDGEGASALLNGLYSLRGRQLVDNHTCVEHRRPNAVSNQLYKGILNDASHAVFNGKIIVRPIAQKTNSYQLNKNLLLGKDCRIETKPQLEIFADDVKCTHGATIGQLDEDEVFYLQTRCIAKKEAIRMLAQGFMEEIVTKVTNLSVQEKLNKLLQPSLAALSL